MLHGLRYVAGSIVARTADPVFVRDMLGDAKLTTTDRYVTAKFHGLVILNPRHFPQGKGSIGPLIASLERERSFH